MSPLLDDPDREPVPGLAPSWRALARLVLPLLAGVVVGAWCLHALGS